MPSTGVSSTGSLVQGQGGSPLSSTGSRSPGLTGLSGFGVSERVGGVGIPPFFPPSSPGSLRRNPGYRNPATASWITRKTASTIFSVLPDFFGFGFGFCQEEGLLGGPGERDAEGSVCGAAILAPQKRQYCAWSATGFPHDLQYLAIIRLLSGTLVTTYAV